MIEHQFTPVILSILKSEFGKDAEAIFAASPILGYLNLKTKAASRGSKSRASFGNIYAVYVLVEDYINGKYHTSGSYKDYRGARFTALLKRQRELPFGAKLQNHHLNTRLNDEFKQKYPQAGVEPIVRDDQNGLYWFNEQLLIVDLGSKRVNLANSIIKIIDAYAVAKRSAFEAFMLDCEKIQALEKGQDGKVEDFVRALLLPNVDARIFEIVSYAILKQFYAGQSIYWGWTFETVKEDFLILYKTGRTNANDGGIDFVMKPLGRFFQVTETLDVKKYFLDIDKVQRFPIAFVVKSNESADAVREKIRQQALKLYGVEQIVKQYMDCIDEIINIPVLLARFSEVLKAGKLAAVITEITTQSKVEFNYTEAVNDDEEAVVSEVE